MDRKKALNKFLKIGLEGRSLFSPIDGFGYYSYNLIKYLSVIDKHNKYDIYFNHSPLFKKTLVDFKQHNLSLKRFQIFPRLFKKLDVYHDNCFSFSQIKTNAKKILTINHAGPFISNSWYSKGDYIFFKRNLERAVSLSDAFIVPSGGAKRDLINTAKIAQHKIHVIHAGMSENLKPSTKYQIELIRARYSIKNPYMLFVGPLEERKNLTRIIEALSGLKYESPPDLVIIGQTKWMANSLNDIIKKFEMEKQIKYLGYIPYADLPPIYNGAEFLIYPALSLGFGTSVMRAMALGLPIISSDIQSAREILGDSALFIDPLSVPKISKAIKQMLSNKDLREGLSKKGFAQSLNFSLKKMAQNTLSLYRTLSNAG